MLNSIDLPTLYFFLFLHFLIGGIGALVAIRKGYNPLLWTFLGMVGGTPSLIASFVIKDKNKQRPLNPS